MDESCVARGNESCLTCVNESCVTYVTELYHTLVNDPRHAQVQKAHDSRCYIVDADQLIKVTRLLPICHTCLIETCLIAHDPGTNAIALQDVRSLLEKSPL